MSCSGRTGNKAVLTAFTDDYAANGGSSVLTPPLSEFEIVSFGELGYSLGSVDVSHLDTDEWIQRVCADLADLQEIPMLVNWRPASQTALPDKGTKAYWQIVFSVLGNPTTGPMLQFTGFKTGWVLTPIANNEGLQATISVQPDGDDFSWAAAVFPP